MSDISSSLSTSAQRLGRLGRQGTVEPDAALVSARLHAASCEVDENWSDIIGHTYLLQGVVEENDVPNFKSHVEYFLLVTSHNYIEFNLDNVANADVSRLNIVVSGTH
jgi:hypothetical protein